MPRGYEVDSMHSPLTGTVQIHAQEATTRNPGPRFLCFVLLLLLLVLQPDVRQSSVKLMNLTEDVLICFRQKLNYEPGNTSHQGSKPKSLHMYNQPLFM